ncbi:MAG: HDIG domain-containing protein [Defluviitaleaceae bacterium]|nr:HDIG domain-containing protein [Defluviitaleaceae bacterium]
MRKHLLKIVYIAVAFFVTCVSIATGSYFNAGLTLEVGSVSEIRVRAPQSFVDEETTAVNRQAALAFAEGLEKTYTIDPSEWAIMANNLSLLYGSLEEIREEYQREREEYYAANEAWGELMAAHNAEIEAAQNLWEARRETAIATGAAMPSAPVFPEPPSVPVWTGEVFDMFEGLPIRFDEPQRDFIVEMSYEAFVEMWTAIEAVAGAVQSSSLIRSIDWLTAQAVQTALRTHALDRTTDELAERIILNLLRTNAVPDDALNNQRFIEAANRYEIVMIPEGFILVDEGEYVTQEIFDILARLDMLAPASIFDTPEPLIGVFFLVAVLFLACLMFLTFYRSGVKANPKESMLLFTLYLLTVLLVWTLSEFSFPFLPILIFPMLVSILIDRRLATALTFPLILICFFIVDGDLIYLLFYSAAGMLFCMFSRYTTERGKSIWVGLLLSAIMFALAVAVTLIVERGGALYDIQVLLFTAGFASVSGILTVFLCMGSLPLWETFFGVVTPVKLLDLTNPTNLLLRRLTLEAPGTYHHSLIVANLAETAAYDIGANAHAARVGGYYHDVGKLKFPHYFVENIDGENPHDSLDSINSAQIIMSHVSYGLTLATEHRLPQFVRDIIKEHHGTTVLQYFYSKARETGAQCEEKDFRYPYIIPQTRESACVMLADSVEAAVRSMIPKIQNVDEVEKTIRFIIRGKLNDGQLAESQLSIKDVNIIEQSFFRVLKGMYHERIAYPAPKAGDTAIVRPAK